MITDSDTRPQPPAGSGQAAARLWTSVADAFDLETHELQLLSDACRTVDLITRLDLVLEAEGPVIDSPQGRKAHPAAVEVRQQRLTLARLLSALRIPAGEEGDTQATARQPRRTGVRGTYAVGGAR